MPENTIRLGFHKFILYNTIDIVGERNLDREKNEKIRRVSIYKNVPAFWRLRIFSFRFTFRNERCTPTEKPYDRLLLLACFVRFSRVIEIFIVVAQMFGGVSRN